MSSRQKFALGLDLLLIGGVLFARQLSPAVDVLLGWQFWGLAPALLFILNGLILRRGGWVIVGSIFAGVVLSGMLRGALGAKTSWLAIVAMLGVGLILAHLADKRHHGDWRPGLTLLGIAAAVFLISGGAGFLPWPQVRDYWPIALIFFGLAFLISALFHKKKEE